MLHKVVKSLLGSFASIIGSQLALGVVGILTLPFVARSLGVEKYSEFSFFLVITGIISSLEFGRVLLIKEYVSKDAEILGDLVWVSLVNIIATTVVSLIAGLMLLSPKNAVILAAIGMFQAMAAPGYARLASNEQIGRAVTIRNIAWAGAYLICAVGTYYARASFPYAFPFLAANMLVYGVYRTLYAHPATKMNRFSWLRIKPYMGQAANIYGFNLTAIVNGSTDRMLLQRNTPTAMFSQYMAQSDLAVRLDLISTAIGRSIYPFMVAIYHEKGIAETLREFRKVYWIAFTAYLVAVSIAMLFHRGIIGIVFGREFVGSINVYPLFMLAFFLNLYGYLFVPLSQAMGDFQSSRKVSSLVALVVLGLGFALVPIFGAYGAVGAFLAGRTTGLIVAVKAVLALPSGSVKKAEVGASILGILLLTLLAVSLSIV